MSPINYLQVVGISVCVVVSASLVRAEVPSNLCPANRCEYLVKNYSGSYPDEHERAAGHWQCYDENTKVSVACTFVRGDAIKGYSDVYRRGGGSPSARFDFCSTGCPLGPAECTRRCCREAGGTLTSDGACELSTEDD
jgi:hypothetical protein